MANFTRTWGGMILETRIEYGFAAHKNRGNYTGCKVHRLRAEYVIGIEDGQTPRPGTFGAMFIKEGKPVLFSCQPTCGCTQGQRAAQPSSRLNDTNVTCEKCK